jgi:hypothetical protein
MFPGKPLKDMTRRELILLLICFTILGGVFVSIGVWKLVAPKPRESILQPIGMIVCPSLLVGAVYVGVIQELKKRKRQWDFDTWDHWHLTSAVQARPVSPFYYVLDVGGPPCLTASVRPNDALMRRTLPRFLWTVGFFALGTILFVAFIGVVLAWSFHDDAEAFYRKGIFAAIGGLMCLIGLPSLGWILSTRGALPGTKK